MNILFLSLCPVWDINEREIYPDLLREFMAHNHNVYIITPVERRHKKNTQLIEQENAKVLKVKTLNIQKAGFIEKGLGTVLIEYQFLNAIKRFFKNVSFDLVLYATPPITLVKPIKYVKKRDNARTYLMLKDIFPQNAVDLGMMHTNGIKGLLYKIFRKKEKQLYAISDSIGCMSQANVDYVLEHNLEILAGKVEICPNSIEYVDMSITEEEKINMRQKYDLPLNAKIFVYGGNLGKPQGIPFLIDCLRSEKGNDQIFFLIVGDGTEYGILESFVNEEKPSNVKLMKRLPKDDYDRMIAACDVGMIFLDYRFTIPNFPSRLLSYMQAGLPVFACTDKSTDIGRVISEEGFGWWCESNKCDNFKQGIRVLMTLDCNKVRSIERKILNNQYSAKRVASIILGDE